MNAQYLLMEMTLIALREQRRRKGYLERGERRQDLLGLRMVRVAVIAKEMIYAKANSIESF